MPVSLSGALLSFEGIERTFLKQNTAMLSVTEFFKRRKYELLLFALMQHLFIGIVMSDMDFYARVIWPLNMLILGAASIGVFLEKGPWKKRLRTLLFVLVLLLPLSLPFTASLPHFMTLLSAAYVVFFVFIFREVMLFLVRPGYINTDIISAAACGYLLLIEISVFLMQCFFYTDPASFRGIDAGSHGTVYMDLVYFCSITVTSIGFGDITPGQHHTKLITSLLGIVGQFYTVVLVGILISKFTAGSNR